MYRSYFEKNNTLISSSLVNTARNECVDLSYGDVDRIFPLNTGETIFTRYIFKVDLDSISSWVDKGVYSLDNVISHTIRLYNTINIAQHLRGEINPYGARRAFGFTLRLYRLEEDFVEGIGHDFRYSNTFVNEASLFNEINDTASNWIYREIDQEWQYEGAISHTGSTLLDTQYFEFGTENAEFDVTDDMQNALSGNTTHYGYAVTFEPDLESREDDRLNTVSFYSKYTETFFEPHLETVFDDLAYDDSIYSSSVYQDEDSDFFIKAPARPIDLNLYDECGLLIGQPEDSEFVADGLYKAVLNISTDRNNFVNFTLGYTLDNEAQTSCSKEVTVLPPRDICTPQPPDTLDGFRLYLGLRGISENERVPAGRVRRVYITAKEINGATLAFPVKYRLYVRQGQNNIEVIPWKDANRVDGKYYFDLNTDWLLPSEYYLELRVFDDVSEAPSPFTRRFFVTSEKKDPYR